MKMKKFWKIKLSTIIIVLLYFVGFSTIADVYLPFYGFIKYILLALIALYLANKFTFLFGNKIPSLVLIINILLLLLSFCLILTSLFNRSSSISTGDYLYRSIIFVLSIVESFFLIEFFAMHGQMQDIYRIFFKLTTLFNLLCDFIIIVYPQMVIKYEDVYFLGTKFNVVYSHIFMLILYRLCKKSNHLLSNVLLYCACIWSILIAIMVDCMTGLIGIVIFIIMDILFKKKPKSITSPWKYLILIAFSALFVLTYNIILKIPAIEYILSNILNTQNDLTGRGWIYSIIGKVLLQKPFLGNGYSSSYDVMMNFMHAPNTQNGLMEWLIEGGITSTIFFLLLVWVIFKMADKNWNGNGIAQVCTVLYILAIFATVEITLNRTFYIIWLALLLGASIENCQNICYKCRS